MRLTIRTLASTALVAASATFATFAGAQTTKQTGKGGGGSPHVTTQWTVNDAHISISYGRPYLKGRAESAMMPIGKPWRTGADEATVITTDKPLTFGSVTLAPGSYTINTEPGATSWQIIFGKLATPKQWGIPYKPELEIGRAPMTLGKTGGPVEQVTFLIAPTRTGGILRMEWGTTSASVPFTIGS
jgi:hypothetical protein